MIAPQKALNIMIVLSSVVIVFHLLVITECIPYSVIWGGKLNSVTEMRQFETVSILINVLMILVFLLRAGYIKNKIPLNVFRIVIGFFALLFSLNTIGNLLAETRIELYVFTPLTLIAAYLCFCIVLTRENS